MLEAESGLPSSTFPILLNITLRFILLQHLTSRFTSTFLLHSFIPATMLTHLSLTLGLAATAAVRAREITFPPVAAVHHPAQQHSLGEHDVGRPIDISGMEYGGLMTYANLPYVHCLAAEGEEVEAYDVAVVGAPFDTVSPLSLPRETVLSDAEIVDVGRDCATWRAVWTHGHPSGLATDPLRFRVERVYRFVKRWSALIDCPGDSRGAQARTTSKTGRRSWTAATRR